MNESPNKTKRSTKVIEFDMDALMTQLKQQYDQSPNRRYYNVDALRYQIVPIEQFEKCPIQVCAYWRIEPRLIKLRIDFKHSNQSGFNLERMREIVFNVDLSNLTPANLNIRPVLPDAFATLRASKTSTNSSTEIGNTSHGPSNDNGINIMQHSNYQYKNLINVSDTPIQDMQSSQLQDSFKQQAAQIRLPPPPSRSQLRSHSTFSRNNLSSSSSSSTGSNKSLRQKHFASIEDPARGNSHLDSGSLSTNPTQTQNHDRYAIASASSRQLPLQGGDMDANNSTSNNTQNESMPGSQPQVSPVPYITYEPQAHWNQQTKQLTWKFDNLLSYHKTDGYGSLLAKLDFRDSFEMEAGQLLADQQATPMPVDVKFMVVDTTISKISMSVDSIGYRMSLLKKEVRSGRYKSEPYIS